MGILLILGGSFIFIWILHASLKAAACQNITQYNRFHILDVVALITLFSFSATAHAQDTTIPPPPCGAPSGTTFHALSFGSITPSGTFQTSYTLPNAAVIGGVSVDVQVNFVTAPAPNSASNTPSVTADQDFVFNTSVSNGSRTVTYNFVQSGTSTPIEANYRIRFADIDQGEAAQVDLSQFSALLESPTSNLTITDDGTAAMITGASGNRGLSPDDTVEFVLLNRSSFTATYFPQSPNTGFFFDGDLSLSINSPMCVDILPITATPETFTTVSGVPGGVTTSILASDTLGSDPVTTDIATLSVVTSDPQISLDTSTGLITVPAGTPDGTYSVTYEICEIANPTNCASATETVDVFVPVSNSQSCPTSQSNRIIDGGFPDYSAWTQGGPNAGALNLNNYTGVPSGQSFVSVSNETAANTSGTLSQNIASGISNGGPYELKFNFGWSNGGLPSTMTLSLAGTDLIQFDTSAADSATDPADFTLLNGTSAIIGGTNFASNASGKIPIANSTNWDLLSINLSLPAGLPDSGDVVWAYTMQQDDWAWDDVTLCSLNVPDLSAVKTVQMVPGDDYAIPGNDVIYTISVSNLGNGPVDTDSIFLVDTLPDEVTFFFGDYNGPLASGTDVIGYTESGVDMDFDPALDAGFSDSITKPASMLDCTYTPNPGEDANVRHVCLSPRGIFSAGTPAPEITFSFRAAIK